MLWFISHNGCVTRAVSLCLSGHHPMKPLMMVMFQLIWFCCIPKWLCMIVLKIVCVCLYVGSCHMTSMWYLQARDALDHGRWLNALIKQTAPAPPSYPLASVSETDSVNTDTVYSDVYEDFVNDSSNVSQKTGIQPFGRNQLVTFDSFILDQNLLLCLNFSSQYFVFYYIFIVLC